MGEHSRIIVGVTGASGAIYASRTLFHLHKAGLFVSLVATPSGRAVVKYEGYSSIFEEADEVLSIDDFFCYAASGSADFKGMAIVPCSMGSLAKLANGISDNLMLRASDVCLKEHRPLVVVPREMPYNAIHVENMRRVISAGGIVVPASPGFYNMPKSIEELADTVVSKVLSSLGVPHDFIKPWGTNV